MYKCPGCPIDSLAVRWSPSPRGSRGQSKLRMCVSNLNVIKFKFDYLIELLKNCSKYASEDRWRVRSFRIQRIRQRTLRSKKFALRIALPFSFSGSNVIRHWLFRTLEQISFQPLNLNPPPANVQDSRRSYSDSVDTRSRR